MLQSHSQNCALEEQTVQRRKERQAAHGAGVREEKGKQMKSREMVMMAVDGWLRKMQKRTELRSSLPDTHMCEFRPQSRFVSGATLRTGHASSLTWFRAAVS